MIHASAPRVGTVYPDAFAGEDCEGRRSLDPVEPHARAGQGSLQVKESHPIEAEREFIQAIEAYKVSSGRMFPTWSEVLEVLVHLGYAKVDRCTQSAS
jgi:hypothetical protein